MIGKNLATGKMKAVETSGVARTCMIPGGGHANRTHEAGHAGFSEGSDPVAPFGSGSAIRHVPAQNWHNMASHVCARTRGHIRDSNRNQDSDYDVRDPMLALLIDVQRGHNGALTGLYRARALVAGGWPITPEVES